MTQIWSEETVDYAGAKLSLFKGGQGPPLLILHGAGGNSSWMPYHTALAESFTVYAPSHPGFDKSQRPAWIDSIVAAAHYYLGLTQHMGLEHFSLLGFSMGGWMAAEMAAMNASCVDRLVLVSAVGIRPKDGQIAELFNVSRAEVARLRFYDAFQVVDHDKLYGRDSTPEGAIVERQNRETASHWCWRPYMHNPNLFHYLKKVPTPTLVLWGRQDAVVPLECGESYVEALPNSRLHVIDYCGHMPQIERPQEFLDTVVSFLKGF